jgi:hypothetical protein
MMMMMKSAHMIVMKCVCLVARCAPGHPSGVCLCVVPHVRFRKCIQAVEASNLASHGAASHMML